MTLGKYAEDGRLASWLHIVFEPVTGKAAVNGLTVETNPGYRRQGHATSLYRHADQQGWGATAASVHSWETQTSEARALARSLRRSR